MLELGLMDSRFQLILYGEVSNVGVFTAISVFLMYCTIRHRLHVVHILMIPRCLRIFRTRIYWLKRISISLEVAILQLYRCLTPTKQTKSTIYRLNGRDIWSACNLIKTRLVFCVIYIYWHFKRDRIFY